MRIIVLAMLLMLLGGCAKTMGVYDNEFSCPRNAEGECLSVEEAHTKALQAGEPGLPGERVISDYKPDPLDEELSLKEDMANFETTFKAYEKCIKGKNSDKCEDERLRVMNYYLTAEDRGQAKILHSVSMQERVTRLAAMEAMVDGGSNTVPVRQPDTVMELHIMPYNTDFGAMSERVVWVVVQEGQWTWAASAEKNSARFKLGETR